MTSGSTPDCMNHLYWSADLWCWCPLWHDVPEAVRSFGIHSISSFCCCCSYDWSSPRWAYSEDQLRVLRLLWLSEFLWYRQMIGCQHLHSEWRAVSSWQNLTFQVKRLALHRLTRKLYPSKWISFSPARIPLSNKVQMNWPPEAIAFSTLSYSSSSDLWYEHSVLCGSPAVYS